MHSSNRIPALDGLRGVAILLVLLWHFIFQGIQRVPNFRPTNFFQDVLVSSGRFTWTGVDLFFVLSGFLIGGSLLDNRTSPKYFSTFYVRRSLRIFPLYFLVVTICWAVFELDSRGWTPYGKINLLAGDVPWWSFFTFTQNLWMASKGSFSRAGLAVTWSLAIEEQFYLTLPLVVRWISSKALVYFLGIAIIGASVLRAILIHGWPNGPFAAYILAPCRTDALGLGVLCALMVRNDQAWKYLISHRRWIYLVAGGLAAGLFLIVPMHHELQNSSSYGVQYLMLALFYASVLLISTTGEDEVVIAIFHNSLLKRLGTIAYGTYLIHYLLMDVFAFLIMRNNPNPTRLALIVARVLAITATLIFAQVSWIAFERPLVRRGHRYGYTEMPRPRYKP